MKNQFKSNINSKINQALKNQKCGGKGEEEKTAVEKEPGFRDMFMDSLAVCGKCFLVGCTVVSAFRLIKDAMKADEEFQKKYGVI